MFLELALPYRSVSDARYYLDYNSDPDQNAAVSEAGSKIVKQHRSPFVFMDNARIVTATFSDTQACESEYMDCLEDCGGHLPCELNCENLLCQDERKERPPPLNEDYSVSETILYEYYKNLIDEVNNVGTRVILNLASVPAFLKNHIEKEDREAIFDAIGTDNGVSFEQPFGRYVRSGPKYSQQEMDVYRDFLDRDNLVLIAGHNPWYAAMAMNIRESGQALFLSRSPYLQPPAWSYWPAMFGKPLHKADVITSCVDCFERPPGRPGDWYVERSYENGKLIAASLNINIDVIKPEGSILTAADIPVQMVDLANLLGKNLSEYVGVDPIPSFGNWSTVEESYVLSSMAVASDFYAKFGQISFPEPKSPSDPTPPINHIMEDFMGLTLESQGTCGNEQLIPVPCLDKIMTSVQIFLRITKAE